MLAALRQRVDGFFASVAKQDGELIHCSRGCDACCYVDLSVGHAEAQSVREALRKLAPDAARALQARLSQDRPSDEELSPCIMLGTDGECAIYAHRPMICRTQGLALRYPADLIHPDALSAKGNDGSDLSWCPLNYVKALPDAPKILDATRVDTVLAQINSMAARDDEQTPTSRTRLRDLVGDLRKDV